MKNKPGANRKNKEGKIISLQDFEDRKEKEAISNARECIEEIIRANGGRMHTKSQIHTYRVGNEIVVRLDDVLELARVMKEKFRKSIEPGYICQTKEERNMAVYALNHLQVTLLSNELSKVDNIDDHKRIIEEHSGKHKKPLTVPGRYAVGRNVSGNCWMFLKEKEDNMPDDFTVRPCLAYRFLAYMDAKKVVESMDGEDWAVIDMMEHLPKEKRLMRDIFAEDSWDEGCENAVRISCD